MNKAPDVMLISHRLDHAGLTLMCLPNVGKPSGFRSCWPEYIYEIEKMDDGVWKDRPQKVPRPSPVSIREMDEVLNHWVPMLNKIRDRRIILMRMLIRPLEDTHVFSWRKIGRKLQMDHKSVQRSYESSVVEIAYKLHSAGMLSNFG